MRGAPVIKIFFVISLIANRGVWAAEEPVLDLRSVITKGLSFSPDVQKATSQLRSADDSYHLAEAKIFSDDQCRRNDQHESQFRDVQSGIGRFSTKFIHIRKTTPPS